MLAHNTHQQSVSCGAQQDLTDMQVVLGLSRHQQSYGQAWEPVPVSHSIRSMHSAVHYS